jgi:phosphonate metabolism-associated iron-containing alcohol dehydrogenase
MSEMSAGRWSYYNPVRITAGAGCFADISQALPAAGAILLVTTPGFTRRGLTARLAGLLGDRLQVCDVVTPNPELDDVDALTDRFQDEGICSIVALGGGSVIDTAKVLSVTLPCAESRVLESVLRRGCARVWREHLPVVAVPTTSGTGAEVTPFATIWDQSTASKYSVTGDEVIPAHVFLDPNLTLSLPPTETLHSALDAISHSLESIWNKRRTPLSEAYALQALDYAVEALPALRAKPGDLANRARMQQASLMAGLAISETRTAIAHAISYPVTSLYGVPHGLACSFTLPALLDSYLPTLTDGRARDVLLRVRSLLHTLNLPAEILKYTDAESLITHVDLMFHPDRAGNYSLEIKREEVADILKHSF